MVDPNIVGESFIEPIAERLGRIERGLSGLAKVVGLELVDIELACGLDDSLREGLTVLGGKLLAIHQLSGSLVQDIAHTLGEDVLQAPITELPPRLTAPTPSVSKQLGKPILPEGAVAEAVKTGLERLSNSETDSEKVDLYSQILDLKHFPVMEIRAGEPVEATIISGNQLVIKGRKITLNGMQLYLFNSLMSLRDKPRAAGEIKGEDFKASSSAFSGAMKPLIELLNNAAGVELIKKHGDKRLTRYFVNPNLTFADKREAVDISADATGDDVKKK